MAADVSGIIFMLQCASAAQHAAGGAFNCVGYLTISLKGFTAPMQMGYIRGANLHTTVAPVRIVGLLMDVECAVWLGGFSTASVGSDS